jgi:DNA-binding transcriptional ArsR family regulator
MLNASLDRLVPKAMEAAETLKALAHETRLLAVCFLGDSEKTVQQLEDFLGTSQSNVSQHLSRLKAAGVLLSRREGKLVYYRVRSPQLFKLVGALQEIFCPPERPEAPGTKARGSRPVPPPKSQRSATPRSPR